VLVYRDTRAKDRRIPPPWLAGAADLLEVSDRQGRFRYWGIGNAHLIGERDDWTSLSDGWQVAVAGPINPQEFRRSLRWCRTLNSEDTQGRVWTGPVVTDAKGNRLILAAYGPDFLPVLNNAQQRAWDVAQAVREHLLAAQEVEDGSLDMSLCARWAAEYLSLTHHVSPEVLTAMPHAALLDESLILRILSNAVGGRIVSGDDVA